jgi:4'-phosphopantetheinyl transferase
MEIYDVKVSDICEEKLKIDNKYIRINKNQYGKPYLKEYPNFNFNISHSGEYVLCAVDDKSIGIDVEEEGKHIDYEEIAKNFF